MRTQPRRPPFRAATPIETALQVVTEEPVPVRTLNGYGFLRAPGLAQNAFVHVRDMPGQVAPSPHARFAFETVESEKGLRAINVVAMP